MCFDENVNRLTSKRKRRRRAGLQQLQKHEHLPGELLAGQDERDVSVLQESRCRKRIFQHCIAGDFPFVLQLQVCWMSASVDVNSRAR